jgi:hypothetical protein
VAEKNMKPQRHKGRKEKRQKISDHELHEPNNKKSVIGRLHRFPQIITAALSSKHYESMDVGFFLFVGAHGRAPKE